MRASSFTLSLSLRICGRPFSWSKSWHPPGLVWPAVVGRDLLSPPLSMHQAQLPLWFIPEPLPFLFVSPPSEHRTNLGCWCCVSCRVFDAGGDGLIKTWLLH